jgi:E3 ubiquitin-protein ligase TRIP12
MLFGRVEEDWSLETLMDSIKADHGYNLDSKSVRNLLQVMSELSEEDRRGFLQFITGSPKLPIGGKFSRHICHLSEQPLTNILQVSNLSRPCSPSSASLLRLPTPRTISSRPS